MALNGGAGLQKGQALIKGLELLAHPPDLRPGRGNEVEIELITSGQ